MQRSGLTVQWAESWKLIGKICLSTVNAYFSGLNKRLSAKANGLGDPSS